MLPQLKYSRVKSGQIFDIILHFTHVRWQKHVLILFGSIICYFQQ